MSLPRKCQILRIYIGANLGRGLPVYESIVQYARRMNMAGATVFRGAGAFGHTGMVLGLGAHTHGITDDQSILIEIIDAPEKIGQITPHIIELVGHHGLVALDEISVLHYSGNSEAAAPVAPKEETVAGA